MLGYIALTLTHDVNWFANDQPLPSAISGT